MPNNMAAVSIKREASLSHTASEDDVHSRRKKLKSSDGVSDSDESENAEDGKSDSKQKVKKGTHTHPHVCGFEGCTRRYTRAEHLHRHQLEHTRTKNHFKCSFEGCDFGCVRKDLLERHEERHNKEGSNLWRRDRKTEKGKNNHRLKAAAGRTSAGGQDQSRTAAAKSGVNGGGFQANGGANHTSAALAMSQSSPMSPSVRTDFAPNPNTNISPLSPAPAIFPGQPLMQQSNHLNGFGSPTELTMNHMAPPFFSTAASNSVPSYYGPRPRGPSSSNMQAFDQSGLMGQTSSENSIMPGLDMNVPDQIYPGVIDGVNQSNGDFDSWGEYNLDPMLADGFQYLDGADPYGSGFIGATGTRGMTDTLQARMMRENYAAIESIEPNQAVDTSSETSADGLHRTPSRAGTPIHHIMGPTDLSKYRYDEVKAYIQDNFENVPQPKNMRKRDGEMSYFAGLHFERRGVLNRETLNLLSKRQMDDYMASYWRDYAPQIPIVHPSFDGNSAQVPLLLAIIAIGATSNFEKEQCEVATFLAWNVRTRVQNHGDIVCPTETWVLQTLVLLEALEKLLSSRLLHERSHQLHGLTVELARRSECFTGPNSIAFDNSNSEISWREFIEQESRKRAAYSVFMTDLFHSCMFNHKAMMKWNEINLALPCSDTLWECTSASAFQTAFNSSENQREDNLSIKPLNSFQATMKKLLSNHSGDKFPKMLQSSENTFLIKALLAGLIGIHNGVEKPETKITCWKVMDTFETWVKNERSPAGIQAQNLTELYAINAVAQINTRASIVYLQQIACPTRILGKHVTNEVRSEAFKQIRRWVRKEVAHPEVQPAGAAVCAAARFLTHVFAKDRGPNGRVTDVDISQYDPSSDHYLHRPWAVYVAILCIWAWAYTFQGPVKEMHIVTYSGPRDVQAITAANDFLRRLMNIHDRQQLKQTAELNRCIGLLTVMADRYHACQWELLREAGDRAEDCARILRRETVPVDDWVWQDVRLPTEEEKIDWKNEREELSMRLQKQYDQNQKQNPLLLQRLAGMQKATGSKEGSQGPLREGSEA